MIHGDVLSCLEFNPVNKEHLKTSHLVLKSLKGKKKSFLKHNHNITL